VSGVLTNDRFIKLSRGYEQEQQELQAQTSALEEQISSQEQKTLDLSRFLTQIRKYTHLANTCKTEFLTRYHLSCFGHMSLEKEYTRL